MFPEGFVGDPSQTNTQEAAPKGSMGFLKRLVGRRRHPRRCQAKPGGDPFVFSQCWFITNTQIDSEKGPTVTGMIINIEECWF